MNMPLLILQHIGPGEIIVVLLLAILLFGAKKIPELARSIGQGLREFKKSVSGIDEEITGDTKGDSSSNSEK